MTVPQTVNCRLFPSDGPGSDEAQNYYDYLVMFYELMGAIVLDGPMSDHLEIELLAEHVAVTYSDEFLKLFSPIM